MNNLRQLVRSRIVASLPPLSTQILGCALALFCLSACQKKWEQLNVEFNTAHFEYVEKLPKRNPDACAQAIRREVPPPLQLNVCIALFYRLPLDRDVSLDFAHLTSFDKYFPNDSMRAKTQALRGELYTSAAHFDSARACLHESIALNLKLGRTHEAADGKRFLARTYLNEGNFTQASQLLLEALNLYGQLDSVDEHVRFFHTRLDLAQAYMVCQDYSEALRWSHSAHQFAYSKPDEYFGFTIIANSNLAENFIYLNQPDTALRLAKRALEIQFEHKHFYEIEKQHFVLGQAYLATGDCQHALRQFQEAIRQASPESNRLMFYKYNRATADAYGCLGRLDSAEYFYRKCLPTKDSVLLGEVHEKLGEIAEKRGNYPLALQLERSGKRLKQETINAGKVKTIASLNSSLAAARHEKQILQLAQQRQSARLQLWTVLLLLLLGLGMSLGLILRQRGHRRILEQQNLLLEQSQTLLAQEKALAEADAKLKAHALLQTQVELSKTQTELDAAARALSLKNEIIAELETKAAKITNATADEAEMAELWQHRILTSEQWGHFRERFEQTFPGFQFSLRTRFPDLTAAETRLFLLLKLRFTNREISEALAISQESVYRSRNRLSKKLGVEDTAFLDDFIRQFS